MLKGEGSHNNGSSQTKRATKKKSKSGHRVANDVELDDDVNQLLLAALLTKGTNYRKKVCICMMRLICSEFGTLILQH